MEVPNEDENIPDKQPEAKAVVKKTPKEDNDWITLAEKSIIRNQFFPPSATDLDMQYCMSVAKNFKLNPILKQIFFIERRSKINNQWVVKKD